MSKDNLGLAKLPKMKKDRNKQVPGGRGGKGRIKTSLPPVRKSRFLI